MHNLGETVDEMGKRLRNLRCEFQTHFSLLFLDFFYLLLRGIDYQKDKEKELLQ
jgi:hypothetical protein